MTREEKIDELMRMLNNGILNPRQAVEHAMDWENEECEVTAKDRGSYFAGVAIAERRTKK